jgi:iron complex transport system substrate-binding protein
VLGARNAAAEARAGLVTVSFEQVLLWNPEVILTTDPNFWKSVWTDRVARGARGRAKRVYLSPHLPFGWFDFPPGANRLLGLWWAGKLLYPQTFADVDLRAKVTEFHRLFYHRDRPRPSWTRSSASRAC